MEDVDPLGRLEMGQPIACELAQVLGARHRAGPKHDEGVRRFAPPGIRQSDDGDLLHRRVAQQHAFHLH